MALKVFTVGHSTLPIDVFIANLEKNEITLIIDVRSVPASAYLPQYNQVPLANSLKQKNIKYFSYAQEFGARRTDRNLLNKKGVVDFEKVFQLKNFQDGINKLSELVKEEKVALLCTEGDPLKCHRFSMISRALVNCDFEISHILKNGEIISQAELEDQAIQLYKSKLPEPTLFEPEISKSDQLKFVYRILNDKIGFKP